MIAVIKASSHRQAQFIEFSAVKYGLECMVKDDQVAVVYNDPLKVLSVIKEAGGTIIKREKYI